MKASYLNTQGKKVVLTQSQVQDEYNKANVKFFDGLLPKVSIISVASLKFFGCVTFTTNRYTGEREFKALKLTHSASFPDFYEFRNTLIHEMIHIWQIFNNCPTLKYNSHGRSFQSWCAKIAVIEPKMQIKATGEGVNLKKESRKVRILTIDGNRALILTDKVYTEQYPYAKELLKRITNLKGRVIEVIEAETELTIITPRKIFSKTGMSTQVIMDLQENLTSKKTIEKFTV